MGLFGALVNIASMPVRVAVDAVLLPKHLMDGDDLLPNTDDGIRKTERELRED